MTPQHVPVLHMYFSQLLSDRLQLFRIDRFEYPARASCDLSPLAVCCVTFDAQKKAGSTIRRSPSTLKFASVLNVCPGDTFSILEGIIAQITVLALLLLPSTRGQSCPCFENATVDPMLESVYDWLYGRKSEYCSREFPQASRVYECPLPSEL